MRINFFKKIFLISFFIMLSLLFFGKTVYVQWREIDNTYYQTKNDKTYVELSYLIQKFEYKSNGKIDSIYIIKKNEDTVFFLFKNNKIIINSIDSIEINDDDYFFENGDVYISSELVSKIFDLEVIENSKDIYFNIRFAKVVSIESTMEKSSARTIIETSSEVNFEIFPLINTYGYLVKIHGAIIPDSVIEKTYNNKIKYIKAYHYSESEIWVKIVLNYKAELKKYIESKKIILDFYFSDVSRPVVVLDPGHGGYDPGALGTNGTMEKDISLKVAVAAKKLLENYNIDVYLTRTTDEYVALYDRAMYTNDKSSDLFISIHLNSFPTDVTVRGSEIYYFDFSESVYSSRIARKENLDFEKDKAEIETWVHDKEISINESETFCSVIKKNTENESIPFRKIASDEFAVLAYTRCPAVLFELEFLSNKDAETKFNNGKYVETFSEIIKDSIIEYFDIK